VQHFSRISGSFRHCHHLVAAITFPILPAALLRCLGAKFLPLQRCLYCDRPLRRFSCSARRRAATRSSRVRSLPDPGSPPNVVHQITQTIALVYIGPGVYAIFTRSSVIVTALLALIFFPEERHILRQWQFQVGTLLGLVGAVGVFWFQPGATAGHVAIRGLLIAFVATTCWALYGVLVKRPSAELGSIRSFGLISLITSVLLFPLTCAFGNVGTPVEVSWFVNLILVISAVTCITMAHVLYYVAIQEIGVALAQTLQLLCPLGAVALSAWIFGEQLTTAQLWSAAILLFGAFLAMRVKPVATTETAENI